YNSRESIDWSGITEGCELDINSSFLNFLLIIQELTESCFETKCIKLNCKNSKQCQWYNDELRYIKNRYMYLTNLYSVTKDSEVKEARNRARRIYRDAIVKAKIDSNNKLIS